MIRTQARFRPRYAYRRWLDRAFHAGFLLATLVGVAALVMLLWDVVERGAPHLTWDFITNFASRFAARSGVKAALLGSLWLIALTALVALPVGIGAAIYLEEYAPRHWFTRFIQVNILNLAGVPSIVYGMLGLAVFVRVLALGQSILAGALTMALLILPILIVNGQEAIRAVPASLRHAAYALGAGRWYTVRRVVLPAAFPGILTGSILALSRALGETAPLILTGAVAFLAFVPRSPLDAYTVLPIQIYHWTTKPKADFHDIAAAAIIALLVLLLSMNALAIWLRDRLQRQTRI